MLSTQMRQAATAERKRIKARLVSDQETLMKLDQFLGLSNGAKPNGNFKKKRQGTPVSLQDRVGRLSGMSCMALKFLAHGWLDSKHVGELMIRAKGSYKDTRDLDDKWIRKQASATIGNMMRAGYIKKDPAPTPVEYRLTAMGHKALGFLNKK